jgi:S1-C subfamily serine protease
VRVGCIAILTWAMVLIAVQPSPGSGQIEDALQQNTDDCFDGVGLSYSDVESSEAAALGGQDAAEFGSSHFACDNYDEDGRIEFAQCTEPQRFDSFRTVDTAPDDWVICLVGIINKVDGRGFRASLDDYGAVLATGEAVRPDARVSSWGGDYKDIFSIDISTERIFSADSENYGLLAFPNMPADDFVLRNLETGNQVVISTRENAIRNLLPSVAAPEAGAIVMTGSGFDSTSWIMSVGNPLRITLDVDGVGDFISLDAEFRRGQGFVLPDRENLVYASPITDPGQFTACPPCRYSRTVEFTPEADKVFQFRVVADGHWTITVEAIGSGVSAATDPRPTPSPTLSAQTPVLTPTSTLPPTGTPTPAPTSTPRTLVIPDPAPTQVPTVEPIFTQVPVAQVEPSDMRDRIIPSAVQLSIMAHATAEGLSDSRPFVSGSGTVVSSSGLILTNWHLVDMETHRRDAQLIEDHIAAEEGLRLEIVLDDLVQVSVSDGMNPPQPRYRAAVVGGDPALDIALLQIVEDSNGAIDPVNLNLPFVPLGDSDQVRLGDPITIYGYPGVGGNSLTLTQGVVSGFEFEVGIAGRAWITTDAGMSGGSSGGTAVNGQGELIGVPTWGSPMDCRPGDTNGDGMTTTADVGCVPTGISLGRLRPANLARDIINRVTGGGATAIPPTWTPTPSPIPPPPSPTPTPMVTPTPVPPATLTPSPIPPTVEPTPELWIGQELLDQLPIRPPLDHASCFGTVDEGPEDFAQVLSRFSGMPDAADRLQGWGWQGSAFRQFGCDGPPEGEAGWIDISVHLFADSTSAQEAVDFFTAVRLDGSPYIQGASPGIGDYSTAMAGPAVNGKDFTIYASQGPYLVRVTGVSPSGIPFMNVLAVANAVLADDGGVPQTSTAPATQSDARSSLTYMPASPALRHADCFSVFTEGTYHYGDVAAALQQTGLSQSQFAALNWQDGAYRVFRCSNPPFGRASQIDVVIHQFADSSSAAVALPYFATTYETDRNESRSCDVAASLVVCVTGISQSGSPLSDVAFVLQQVVGAAR